MKNLIRNIFAAIAVVACTTAAAGSFLTEKNVSNNPSQGAQFPEVAYSSSGIHVVWEGFEGGKAADIFYARSTDNGSTWSTAVNLTNNATASSGNNRPQVVSSGNTVVVGWNSDNNTGAVYVRTSTNGGASFGSAQLVGGVEGGFYSRLTDLMLDSSGNVHVSWYDNADTSGASGMVYHRMICGATLGASVAVTNKDLDGDFDNEQPRIAEFGGRIYVVYRGSGKGNPQGGWPPYTFFMKSGTVSGCALANVSYPARRIAGGLPLSLNSTSRPEIYPNGTTMHFAWWDNTNGFNVHYRKGNPVTGSLGAASRISDFGLDHLEPGYLTSTAATAAGGYQTPPGLAGNGSTVLLAYQRISSVTSVGTPTENGPIYLRESSDNGTTWGPELPIAGTSQATTPRLAISGDNVGIVWTDIRSAPTPQIYFRRYTLGAATTPQFSVSPNPQDFGAVTLGTSAERTFQVVNTGTAGSISGLAFTGDWSLVSSTCPGSVGAGATCSFVARFSPSTIGARTGSASLSTNAPDSPTVVSFTGSGVQASQGSSLNTLAVIRGFYETILGRTPDSAGVDFWNGEAGRVVSLGSDVREVFFALSVQFFNTPEYLNRNTSDTQYLTDLYKTFFLREPDSAGMAYWQSQLSGGMDRGALLTNFLFSTEFSNKMTSLFGSPTIRPEINLTIDLYRGILGVLPDSAGFNFWLGEVRKAQCQGGDAVIAAVANLATGFITSAEYSNRESARPASERTKRHVGDLYNAFLRRGADLDGYKFWVSQIDTGAQTREQVRAQGFLQSPEFQARVNQVIAAGCFTG